MSAGQRQEIKRWLSKLSDVEQTFQELDVNGDGLLSYSELAQLADRRKLRPSTCQALYEMADTDHDGCVSLTEFSALGQVMKEIESLKKELGVAADAGEAVPVPKELEFFLKALKFGTRSSEHTEKRKKVWREWDPNGNGYLSLAEVDRGLRHRLETKAGRNRELGTKVWRHMRPSFIRAFNDANDAAPPRDGPLDADDYVTRSEFRVLIVYLRLYATMFEVFALVDGGSAGTTAEDDRRISRAEWNAAIPVLHAIGHSWAPFVALQDASPDDFDKIDADGHGMVLLVEFCAWIEAEEIAAGTEIGNELSIGD